MSRGVAVRTAATAVAVAMLTVGVAVWVGPRSAGADAAPACSVNRRTSGAIVYAWLTCTGGAPGTFTLRSLEGDYVMSGVGSGPAVLATNGAITADECVNLNVFYQGGTGTFSATEGMAGYTCADFGHDGPPPAPGTAISLPSFGSTGAGSSGGYSCPGWASLVTGGLCGVVAGVVSSNCGATDVGCWLMAGLSTLFVPGPSTMKVLNTLWTDIQTRIPFSYGYELVSFIGGAVNQMTSPGLATCTSPVDLGLPAPRGSVQTGYLCADQMPGMAAFAGLRVILELLFLVGTALAMYRTTMRVIG